MLAVAFLAVTGLAGCHAGSSWPTVTAISQDDTVSYFVREHAGLAEAARRDGFQIHWNGSTDSTGSEQQIAVADKAIRSGDHGLVVTPLSPTAMNAVLRRALQRHLPVVVLGAQIPMPADPNLSFVLNDFKQSGSLAAQRLHQRLGATDEVALIGLDPASPATVECATSFRETLHRLAPGIHIVTQLAGSRSTGKAETMVVEVLTRHPHLRAIYSLDIWAMRGAFAAVRDAGREGSVLLLGNDEAMDLIYLLHHGAIDSLVVEDMRSMGVQAIYNIATLHRGQSVPVVTIFEPVLLTADNITTEPMQQRLRMDWRPTIAAATR